MDEIIFFVNNEADQTIIRYSFYMTVQTHPILYSTMSYSGSVLVTRFVFVTVVVLVVVVIGTAGAASFGSATGVVSCASFAAGLSYRIQWD